MFILDLFLLFIYKLLLDISYYNFILPIYGAEVIFNYGELLFNKLLLSYLILILVWVIVYPVFSGRNPISRVVFTIYFCLVFVPFLTLVAQEDRNINHAFYIAFSLLLIAFILRLLPRIKIPKPDSRFRVLLLVFLLLLLAYTLFGLVATGGFGRLNFDFSNVYETRDHLKANAFPLSGYVLSWSGHVANIALLCLGILRKNKAIVISSVLIQVLLFGLANFKSFIVLPFTVVALIYLLKNHRLLTAFLIGSIGSVLLFLLWGGIGSLMGYGLVSRVFMIPAALHSLYFDFYSVNPPSFLSGTKWESLFGGGYEYNNVLTIALEYWGREFSPNVGWFADAYSNFGWGGAVVIAVLLGLFLKICDSIAINITKVGIAESLFIGVSMALINSSFMTSLLTHGALLAVLMLWWLSGYNEKVV